MWDLSKQASLRGVGVEDQLLGDGIRSYHSLLDGQILNGDGSARSSSRRSPRSRRTSTEPRPTSSPTRASSDAGSAHSTPRTGRSSRRPLATR
jgi:hypothetical protein